MRVEPTLIKPPHGTDCNGCGRCCTEELCPLGAALFVKDDGREFAPLGAEGPCPALEAIGEGKFTCGLVAHPETYWPVRAAIIGKDKLAAAARILIGAGCGCDAQLDTEEPNNLYREWLLEWADRNERKIKRAKEAWGFGHVTFGRF